jgi:hypothetical protein
VHIDTIASPPLASSQLIRPPLGLIASLGSRG